MIKIFIFEFIDSFLACQELTEETGDKNEMKVDELLMGDARP